MITQTERLILRRFSEDDLLDLFEYLSDPLVVEFEPHRALTVEETKERLRWCVSTDEMIAVELKSNHKLIGNVYLSKRDFGSVEIGFIFNKNYWNEGYASESCRKLIAEAFDRGVHRIYAECDPENQGSWKLLEKLGFSREAHFKQNLYFWKNDNNQPIWKDTFVYSLLNVNG